MLEQVKPGSLIGNGYFIAPFAGVTRLSSPSQTIEDNGKDDLIRSTSELTRLFWKFPAPIRVMGGFVSSLPQGNRPVTFTDDYKAGLSTEVKAVLPFNPADISWDNQEDFISFIAGGLAFMPTVSQGAFTVQTTNNPLLMIGSRNTSPAGYIIAGGAEFGGLVAQYSADILAPSGEVRSPYYDSLIVYF